MRAVVGRSLEQCRSCLATCVRAGLGNIINSRVKPVPWSRRKRHSPTSISPPSSTKGTTPPKSAPKSSPSSRASWCSRGFRSLCTRTGRGEQSGRLPADAEVVRDVHSAAQEEARQELSDRKTPHESSVRTGRAPGEDAVQD